MPSTKNDQVLIKVGRWEALKSPLVSVRTTVFIEEQAVPVELEWDEEDAMAWHLLALDVHNQALGCARLLPSGQIGRMAVLIPYRGKGIGARLLEAAETVARQEQMREVFLHAQTHAIPFYSRFGYRINSDIFMDAGIPHRTMRKTL